MPFAFFLLPPPLPGQQIPTPRTHFGHDIGVDRVLLDWEKVVGYFQLLQKSSPRIKVEELGKTTGGRPFIAATIAAPDTLQNLGRYIDIQRRLADPRLTPEPQMEDLVKQGKSVVLITCSIHSTEVASTHTAVEFAYRLLSQDTPRFRAILENTIFILVPSLNPDGVDIVTQWYRKTMGTPFEGSSPPELYQKYVGHDNNRDWYMFTQPETRLTISKLHNVWRPHIVYDVHQQGQTGSRLFVPPWLDPVEPNVDAILVQEMNHIGTGMALDLTAAGKPGVNVHGSYDFWTPARHYQSFHGGLRILTESASARLATPVTIPREKLDVNALGFNPQERSWNHPEPWPGGEWRLRDIIDYQLIAFESCLYQAALRRLDLQRNFYSVAKRQVERKSPYAFLIPAQQRDPGATRRLVETLVFGMVEVEIDNDGSRRIRMGQPYGGWAKALLERQKYPDLRMYPGGPPRRPYDVTAHTLPLLMGVDVRTLEQPLDRLSIVPAAPTSRARLSGSDTDSWQAVNQIWKQGGSVFRETKTGDFSSTNLGPGWKPLKRPRIGLYKSHTPVMDEGWTRWVLEQFEFQYSSLGNKEIQAGGLIKQYDVLVFPDQTAVSIAEGFHAGAMPEEYTGGLDKKGAAALQEFAAAGGTLIFLNHAAEYATDHLGLRAKNVLKGVGSREFYCPGSLLNVKLDTTHPLALGLPADIPIWAEASPAWETEERTVARYPDNGILASGWLLGDKLIARRSALVEAPMGKGRAILFGMRPQYRGQSYLTFKLFFNALVL
ncbi:MAG: peptidase M14 [Acidobacteria bacterium]|nr:peptidase M14 [Acidobacteriota bacterium]